MLVIGNFKFLRQISSCAIIRNMEMMWTELHSSLIPAICGCAQVYTYATFQTGKDQRGNQISPTPTAKHPTSHLLPHGEKNFSKTLEKLWVSSCFSFCTSTSPMPLPARTAPSRA